MHTSVARRSALKASGVSIALPLLESMSPAVGGEEQQPPRRMVMICNTLGLHPPSLFPASPGADYETTEYLDILNEHRKDFTLFSGLSHPDQTGKQPHDTEMTWLTAARNPGLGGFRNSISVDQVAANHVGRATRFASVALSTNTKKSQSYTANGVMIPAEDRPSQLFSKLFLTGSAREVRRQRQDLADGRSILDRVADQTQSLKKRTSANDDRQLDEYFEAIRKAETDLAASEAWLDRPKPKVNQERPRDIVDSADMIGRARTLFNLIPLMLQTDSTRVVTMVIQDHLVVPKIKGVSAEHHNLSHHGRDPEKIKQLKIIETEILTAYSDFLSAMAGVSEVGSRLLDRTSVLFGSNLGNANAHDPKNLPIILAGGGSKHGRYVRHKKDDNTPLCNLFVTLLQQMGVETDQFATSDGILDVS